MPVFWNGNRVDLQHNAHMKLYYWYMVNFGWQDDHINTWRDLDKEWKELELLKARFGGQ